MEDVEDIAERAWRTTLTVRLELADSDVATGGDLLPLLLQVPRFALLHGAVAARGARAWAGALPATARSPWLEAGALPLRWAVPAGVLHALVAPPGGAVGQHPPPWRLRLRMSGYPSDVLAVAAAGEGGGAGSVAGGVAGGDDALPSSPSAALAGAAASVENCLEKLDKRVRAAFFSSLKEATHVLDGDADAVQSMSVTARDELWRAAAAGDRAAAAPILRSLRPPGEGGARRGGRLPVRLYVRWGGEYLSSYKSNVAHTSRPVAAAATPDGGDVGLGAALAPLVAEAVGGGADAAGMRVLVGPGLAAVPMDAPLRGVHAALHAPDRWLYVVVHV